MGVGPLLHGPPRWTIVVRANDAALYAQMRQRFPAAPWVAVILDRRRCDRRHAAERPRWSDAAPSAAQISVIRVYRVRTGCHSSRLAWRYTK